MNRYKIAYQFNDRMNLSDIECDGFDIHESGTVTFYNIASGGTKTTLYVFSPARYHFIEVGGATPLIED